MHTDNGKEFYNSKVSQLFDNLNIHLYSTNNEPKAAIAERVIRTLKERIEPLLTQQELEAGTVKARSWLSVLPQVVRDYNTSYHSTIKMTPEQASKEENQPELSKLYFELFAKRTRIPKARMTLKSEIMCVYINSKINLKNHPNIGGQKKSLKLLKFYPMIKLSIKSVIKMVM